MKGERHIIEAFEKNFRDYGELGASVSVWKEGREIVSLHSGFAVADETRPWTERSLVPVYSATKAPASAALLLALHRQGASPEMSMGELWPEFAAAVCYDCPDDVPPVRFGRFLPPGRCIRP